MTGLEAALLGGSEVGGNREVGEVDEGLADLFQPLLDVEGTWGDHGTVIALGPGLIEGVLHELAALGLVGDAVGREEPKRFSVAQPMALNSGENRVLALGVEGAEGVGESGADVSFRDALLGCRGEMLVDGETPSDPLRGAPQSARHLLGSEAVLLQ